MANPNPTSARMVAIQVLNRFDLARVFAGQILDQLIGQTSEKQRATDLVFGTIRNRKAIDEVITKFAAPVSRITKKMLNIIRVGTYELVYSPQTAEYAIVNEAVENTRLIVDKKQTGFVNAVLREIERHIENRQAPLSLPDIKRILPQNIAEGCVFDTEFLPDPQALPSDYLSTAFSLPKWLIEDWLNDFGFEQTRQICFASNRRPSVYILPNTLKISLPQLCERLHEAGIDYETSPDQVSLKLKSPKTIRELPGYDEGLFSVQDITASQPVRILDPQSNWTILDLCAAPGTKTAQLAQMTGDKAKIIITDIDDQRLEKVKENISRLGLTGVTVVHYEELENVISKFGTFDAVLLDVPCSNTGVLSRRPEARYRVTADIISSMTKTQSDLLEKASSILKPGGRICYSTCSIQKGENANLIRAFLKNKHDFQLQSETLTLPSAEGFDHDGGYVVIISKT